MKCTQLLSIARWTARGVLVPVLCASLLARPLERERTWEELPVTIGSQRVSLVLPDHTRLRGFVREFQPEKLVLEVGRTSNSRLHPKGTTEIPRAQISVIDVYLRHGPPTQHNGAAVGAGLGGVVMAPVALTIGDGNLAPDWVAALALIGGIVVGALLGRLADRDSADSSHILITVIPQSLH